MITILIVVIRTNRYSKLKFIKSSNYK
ncbi:hypothetical protein CMUS01_13399 [Colletotrichum musicola]|uniref:Uncharacterized protein n=1 Tax=Colletotrichum musicola TaxID=2175873 RepID=A0A8H6MWF1_9PEZI|nr:hypothetical protein CMUS01_13399 [Colletotrichum musicola]